MSESRRPTPDELLARIRAEEQKQTRGKLKIFLGYAAGVGKTYAMLEAARQRQAEGVDVVVAYVETHGRVETEALLQGLPVLPRKQVEYRGVTLSEMDLEAVLARKPQLALVDELAHTNAPGARHPKRYRDVEEIVEAGIDVYTTLNIQHVESLLHIVAPITAVPVRETIPDRVIDHADEIELIDLPPDELLQRLREGKVYVPDQAARAMHQFFRKGNLTALRELAMRRAAERVDDQMRDYMETRAIPGPWRAAERLLVCISPGSLGERLVRHARHLADELNAEWFAIYVETPDQLRLPTEERNELARTQQLAEVLGARVYTLHGPAVAPTVLKYARKHNVTQLIVGSPRRSRWQEWLHGSVVDALIQQSGDIDVHVVGGEPQRERVPREVQPWLPHRPYWRYLQAIALVIAATLLSALAFRSMAPTNLVMIYLLAVVIAAVYLGRGPAVVVSFLSVAAFDFFFIPPYLTFVVDDPQHILTFIGFLAVGLVISGLAARVREQAEAAHTREIESTTLYNLSRDLAIARGLDDIMHALVHHTSETFGRQVAVLLPENEMSRHLTIRAQSQNVPLDQNELAVATWAYEHAQPAGRGTDTLPAAQWRYLPLKTAHGTVGVLGVKSNDVADAATLGATESLPLEQQRLLESFASQAALAIERAQFAEQAREAQVLQATEKLQTALLNSISHDLRTPLVSITGALSSLNEDAMQLDKPTIQSMVETAYAEAQRLNHLVGNLLDMTRIEAGVIKVKKEPCDVEDVIGSALDRLADQLKGRKVLVDVPSTLPLVPMDFVLMVQVLVNLLDNALKYSPPDAPIDVSARAVGNNLQVEVADRGIGIRREDLTRVFDKFYRVQRADGVTGTGLGLSICKGLVEAQHGQIRADNRDGGGTVITVTLPLDSGA